MSKDKRGCDHTVSYREEDGYGGGSWLEKASYIDWKWSSLGDGERFRYCPDCGASLADFWQAVDASREDHQREQERAHKIAAEKAALERLYSRTPPT